VVVENDDDNNDDDDTGKSTGKVEKKSKNSGTTWKLKYIYRRCLVNLGDRL